MSLLECRRSHSESRKIGTNDAEITADGQQCRSRSRQMRRGHLENTENVPGMGRRKTSAELISEAKIYLGSMSISNSSLAPNQAAASAVGGVRLLNTRRPITPREPGRALYGKVALAGRPPSAFSLRYLQNENPRTPKTPSLEPIKGQNSLDSVTVTTDEHSKLETNMKRSSSFDVQGTIFQFEVKNTAKVSDEVDHDDVVRKTKQTKVAHKKLPALEVKGFALSGNMNVKPRIRNLNQYTKNPSEEIPNDIGASNKAVNLLASRRYLSKNCDVLEQSSTEKLIQLLKEHAGIKDCSVETVQHIDSILSELYLRVRKNEKNFKRGLILGGLYGLVECTASKILLDVAKVVLALRVTGSNLTGACKLIFKVARNDQNDSLFYGNDLLELLIDGLGRASPLDDPEACIYGYGSIRFLTSANGQERNAEVQNETLVDMNKNSSVHHMEMLTRISTMTSKSVFNYETLKTENYQKMSKQCTLMGRLARHGAVELMVLHLQILNEAGATQKLSGPPLHSLYQLSATLRALADVRQFSLEEELDENNVDINGVDVGDYMGGSMNASVVELDLACPHLVRAAEISIGELEVQANIVRTLSVLSDDENCCKALSNYAARIGMMLGPCLELFNGASEKLLSHFSRLGYVLGNIMAKFDEARVQFYHNDVAMENLLRVMELYAKAPLTMQNSMGDTVIDVLIKMIRVIANMSVNSEVGFGLGNTHTLGSLLLKLLDSTNQSKTDKTQQNEEQELTLGTLCALHNLCFYQDKNSTPTQVLEAKDSIQSVLLDVTTSLCIKLRTCNDVTIEVETARVLGNITRNDMARKYFCKAGGLSLIVQNLRRTFKESESLSCDLRACACGVLVNLLGDTENRAPFLQMDGVSLLTDLLRRSLEKKHDWFLATIICQAFWNLLIDAPTMTDICDERRLDEICDLLSDYLDDQVMFDIGNNVEPDVLWENFAMVATDLLERIQNNFEQQNQQENMFSYINDDEDDVYIERM